MKSIFVTSPNLPPLSEFYPYLEEIWKSKNLTNNGQFHQKLEIALADYLGVEYISLFSNGTIALLTALKALNLSGDVITTPFSFVATSHSLMWNNLRPIFVDVEEDSYNINPLLIKDAIDDRTSAILPVHCYGNPCKTDEIDSIAKSHNLSLIYDSAHAFGVKSNGASILNSGDYSILSFHATKVFNTFEGGAIVSKSLELKNKIDSLKNFGFKNEFLVTDIGINGKMNEVQSAFGLLQLKYIDRAIERRRQIDNFYRSELSEIYGLKFLNVDSSVTQNYSYFPILFCEGMSISRDQMYERLKLNNIFSRKYFFPLISNFPCYAHLMSSSAQNLPIANKLANNVLCLPIYPDLTDEDLVGIVNLIKIECRK